MEEGLNYPAPLAPRQLPPRLVSARPQKCTEDVCNADKSVALGRPSQDGRRAPHSRPRSLVTDTHIERPMGGRGGEAGTLSGLLCRPVLKSSGVSRRLAQDVRTGRTSRAAEASRIRPTSVTNRLGPSSSFAPGKSSLQRTRSTPTSGLPPNLVHASAVAEGWGGSGAIVKAGRIPQGASREIKSAAERCKNPVVSRLAGQLRPRLDPTQRLPPAMLRKGNSSR